MQGYYVWVGSQVGILWQLCKIAMHLLKGMDLGLVISIVAGAKKIPINCAHPCCPQPYHPPKEAGRKH